MKLLLEYGANDYQDHALSWAKRKGNTDIINLLVSKPALIVAVEKGHDEIVRALLLNGTNVNRKTTDGYTALMLASKNGHKNIVEVLIQNKANAMLLFTMTPEYCRLALGCYYFA